MGGGGGGGLGSWRWLGEVVIFTYTGRMSSSSRLVFLSVFLDVPMADCFLVLSHSLVVLFLS